MERFEELLDYINELNNSGRIPYEDYSRLYDLASELGDAVYVLDAAKTDIAALLWLNGNCEYCAHGRKEEFSGANRWYCALGNGVECKAEWRGASTAVQTIPKADPPESPTSTRAKPSRAERFSGRGRHGQSPMSLQQKQSQRNTKAFCSLGAPVAGSCTVFAPGSPSRSTNAGTAEDLPRCTDSHRLPYAASAGNASNIGQILTMTRSPIPVYRAVRRWIWPITRKPAHIRRCCDARYHRSRKGSGRAGHRHKGANRAGLGAVRRYPGGIGGSDSADIPADADRRGQRPATRQKVRTDKG